MNKKLSHNRIHQFEITYEMRQIGVSRICVVGKNLLVYNARKEPAFCQYDRDDLTKTLNRLRKAFKNSHEFDYETIEKILILLSQVMLSWETANREVESKDKSTYEKARIVEIAAIKTEIERVKNANVGITSEEWRIGLVERYNEHRVTSTKVKAQVFSKTSIRNGLIEQTQEEFRRQNETDILSRIIQFERELGCQPGLLDLLCHFSREEIDAVWDSLVWIYPDLTSKGATTIPEMELMKVV